MKTLLIILLSIILISCEGGGAAEGENPTSSFTGDSNDSFIPVSVENGTYRTNCQYIGGGQSEDIIAYVSDTNIGLAYYRYYTTNCSAGTHEELTSIHLDRHTFNWKYSHFQAKYNNLYYDSCGLTGISGLPTQPLSEVSCYPEWQDPNISITGDSIYGYTINGLTFQKQ